MWAASLPQPAPVSAHRGCSCAAYIVFTPGSSLACEVARKQGFCWETLSGPPKVSSRAQCKVPRKGLHEHIALPLQTTCRGCTSQDVLPLMLPYVMSLREQTPGLLTLWISAVLGSTVRTSRASSTKPQFLPVPTSSESDCASLAFWHTPFLSSKLLLFNSRLVPLHRNII